ncbi:type 1 glutamine amidotransferase domain-containing protein [Cellulomonas sp. IC4_254]|uniref:type 1 glutamine amidotransferase domain-containing protein n=1 Tax=Cellulomonas sp. IC4_254 TaxID=2714040 RepID=UPI001423E3A1|nr:type 1 glutamine amidotransferase domain-containing protein [Cellulomonas sp. IC4_254]NHT16116.1 type 1 glutamine amidotransferase domain-containing protein [Cellulomonas sp. IC4_254]
MARILFVMTGADGWTLTDGTVHPTGYWADEVAVPYESFTSAGHAITVATPGGVVPPVDPGSLSDESNGGADQAAHVRAVLEGADELRTPVALDAVDLAGVDAIYVPGGHGPMEDLAVDATSGALLAEALSAGTPLGIVCHGPAALLAAVDAEGRNVFEGYRITAFTDEEERLAGTAATAPWLLEQRLVAAGIQVVAGAPFAPHVEVDRTLVTGQNPASSGAVAAELLTHLG